MNEWKETYDHHIQRVSFSKTCKIKDEVLTNMMEVRATPVNTAAGNQCILVESVVPLENAKDAVDLQKKIVRLIDIALCEKQKNTLESFEDVARWYAESRWANVEKPKVNILNLLRRLIGATPGEADFLFFEYMNTCFPEWIDDHPEIVIIEE